MRKEELLSAVWGEVRDIALFGFGRQGRGYIAELAGLYRVAAIIDNGKAGGEYNGIPVLSWQEFRRRDFAGKIVITASGRAHREITEILMGSGLLALRDFMDVDMFLAFSNWYKDKRLVLGRVAIPVTERCTFRCEQCMVSVPYIKAPVHYSCDSLCADADMLFSRADYVGVVQVFGGEPYLNKDLPRYIAYLEREYKDRIGIIQIISNASVLPSEELLKVFLENGNIDVRFSDYTAHVPYQKRFDEVQALLRARGIACTVERFGWLDMGHPLAEIRMGASPEEIAAHMADCSGRCQTFSGGKYYFCSRAWGAEKAYGVKLAEGGDWLDCAAASKEDLMLFHVGLMRQGFSPFCGCCRGFDCGIPLEPGVQIAASRKASGGDASGMPAISRPL